MGWFFYRKISYCRLYLYQWSDLLFITEILFIIYKDSNKNRTAKRTFISPEAKRYLLDYLLYRKEYINELKSLEVNDKDLKEKSLKYTEKMSTIIITTITYKVDELEKAGFKKHVITQDAVDSANAKLQKFSALRTCEAWLKFT